MARVSISIGADISWNQHYAHVLIDQVVSVIPKYSMSILGGKIAHENNVIMQYLYKYKNMEDPQFKSVWQATISL